MLNEVAGAACETRRNISHVAPAPPPSRSEAKLRRLLPLLIASQIAILGFVVVVGFTVQDRWNGIYLVWGIAIGVLGAADQLLSAHVLPKIAGVTHDQAERFRRSTLRRRIVMMDMVTLGIAAGALSAILDNMACVLIFTVLVLLSTVSTYLLAPVMVRRIHKRARS
jgi:hypothetical protein